MTNLFNQRFVFFSPPNGVPEGGGSKGPESVEDVIKDIIALTAEAERVKNDPNVSQADKTALDSHIQTAKELQNVTMTGQLDNEQKGQLEYALDKIRDITGKYNENPEDNPNNLAEQTKEAAGSLFNAANKTTNNAPKWLTEAVFGKQADAKPDEFTKMSDDLDKSAEAYKKNLDDELYGGSTEKDKT